jgi:hypothetical protein
VVARVSVRLFKEGKNQRAKLKIEHRKPFYLLLTYSMTSCTEARKEEREKVCVVSQTLLNIQT